METVDTTDIYTVMDQNDGTIFYVRATTGTPTDTMLNTINHMRPSWWINQNGGLN